MITDTWKVLDTATTEQDNAVFLEVVPFAADVRNDLKTVGQLYALRN